MRRTGSPRVEGYAILAAAGLVVALVLRRPELAACAAPFALVLFLGVRRAHDPDVRVTFSLAEERTVEGQDVPGELAVEARATIDRLEVLLELPRGVDVARGDNPMAVRLRANELRTLELDVCCGRWGVYEIGDVEVRARDALRMVVWERRFRLRRTLKAYPTPDTLHRLLVPVETQALTGNEVARVKGDGIEYADLREYLPGDRLRAINWRASARRHGLVVSERHPERNTDVVLVVDSFSDLRSASRSTLSEAVRATATLASRYLERRDRVGLVAYGGTLRWLRPGLGVTQRFQLVETLLETDVEPTYTWRNVNVIPGRTLPSNALVLALTPLVDDRFATALQDLRARGFDVAVLEVDPVGVVEPGPTEAERIAHRLWLLERETLRQRLARLGIPVARWDDEKPLEVAVEEVRRFRRYARLARVS
jgi:uncharacterized protein (DUF58 family)